MRLHATSAEGSHSNDDLQRKGVVYFCPRGFVAPSEKWHKTIFIVVEKKLDQISYAQSIMGAGILKILHPVSL
jgi:hypothetical protein